MTISAHVPLPSRAALAAAIACLLAVACGDDASGDDDDDLDAPDAAVVGSCPDTTAEPGDPVTATEVWRFDTTQIGFQQGSPSLCDLDHDGRLELIAPIAPPVPSPGLVAVLDAATGAVRWQTPPTAPPYANPYCVDVDDDGIDDVLVGGRTGDIVAHSGVDGTPLWTLSQGDPAFFLGNTSAPVSEATDATTLFIAKGGGGNGLDIPDVPGHVFAFDLGGVLLAKWDEPNEAEIYSTPAVLRAPDDALLVAVGAGGERLGGALFLLEYDEAAQAFTERFSLATTCTDGGFVSSPVFGDVTGDGTPELIGVDYCGKAHVLDLTGEPVWTYETDVLYGTANALLADFNRDGALDVLVSFESFNFSYPVETSANARSEVVALDGTNGDELWRYESDKWVFASPVSADFDADGTEDVLIAIPGAFLQKAPELTVLSGVDGSVLFTEARGETAGTPVIGDVDDDGHLDVILPDMDSTAEYASMTRLEFCGRPYDANASESGFRGYPAHDGTRK